MATATGAAAQCLKVYNAQAYYSVKEGEVLVKNVHASTWKFDETTYHVVAYRNTGIFGKSFCQVIDNKKQPDQTDKKALIVRKGLTDVLFVGRYDEFSRLKKMEWKDITEALNEKDISALSKAVENYVTKQKETRALEREMEEQKLKDKFFDLHPDKHKTYWVDKLYFSLADRPGDSEDEEQDIRVVVSEDLATHSDLVLAEKKPTLVEQAAPVVTKKSLAQRVSHCNATIFAVAAGIVTAWIISRI
ncbi:MAG: hypothetical protein JXA94_07270 [Parachlamydiales bacterium]|nr:hypothetical protein [Parachlamydiales bacterium]